MKCETGFRQYSAISSNMVSHNYPIKKNWFWSNYGTCLEIPHHDVYTKKTSMLICLHVLISFLPKMMKYKHFKNRTLCLFYKTVQDILLFRQNRALCDMTENCSLKNGTLTHEMQKFPSYRNQSINLQSKSFAWFLCDGNLVFNELYNAKSCLELLFLVDLTRW